MTVEEHLRQQLAKNGIALTGKVFLVGLDQFNPDLGLDESRKLRSIEAAMESAIQKRLGDDDYMSQVEGYGFLIVFGGVTEEEARLKCSLMVEEVTRFLFGKDIGQGAIKVNAIVAEVDGSVIVDGVSVTDTVSQLLDQVAETGAKDNGVLASKTEDKPAEWENEGAENLQFIFRPMWDVKRKVISTYVCVPTIKSSISSGYHFGYSTHMNTVELDIRTLDRVINEMHGLLKKGRKLLMGLSVHTDTLLTPGSRQAYSALLKSIPDEVRQYLVFEMTGTILGLPETRLLEFVTLLSQFGRNVLARVPLSDCKRLEVLKRCGIVAIGDELSLSTKSEVISAAQIEKFAENADKAGLNTYLHGLRTLSLVTAAVAAGIDHIDGDPIKSLAQSPEGVFRYETMDLYSRFLKGK